MKSKIPRYLYKYQTYNEHSIENISHNKFWFSKPGKINDPFDCSLPFNFTGTDNDYQQMFTILTSSLKSKNSIDEIKNRFLTGGQINDEFKDYLKKIYKNENKKKINEFQQYGIACLTEVSDSILMWSHYANSHKGFCLQFDTSYFHNTQNIHRVIYSNSYPKISILAITEGKEMPITPLITKSTCWKYEREWRLISFKGDISIDYDPRALISIYFGCWMPKNQMKETISLLGNSQIGYYHMQRSDKEFKLISTKLDL